MLKASLMMAWRGLGHLTRVAIELVMLLLIAGGVLLLALRYWVLPDIERYHEQITVAASASLGQPLTIGKIAADWNGLRPRLLLSDVQILDKQGKVALSLPRLENTVAWTSLFTAELRFHRLEIESPDLLVRRDAQGQLYVAGIPLTAQSTDEETASDWLLHQSSVLIRNGRITWQDELRSAPALVFEQVTLRIENHFGRHRFAISALPPDRLSSRLDVRGSFYGDSFSDMRDWQGELYTQLEYADVAAWKSWVALPGAFKRGKGALRVWLGIDRGQLDKVDVDVALAGVQARLAEALPQLDLKELRGRIAWHQLERGFEVSTRQLALQMRDGFKLKPTDFYLRLAGGQGYQLSSGEMRANALDLGNLGRLAEYLPLNADIQKQLSEAQPQGRITGLQAQWQGEFDKIARYSIKGRFSELSLLRLGNRPGFSGLSGEIDGTDNGGSFNLDSRNLKLDAPAWFMEPITFDQATGQLGWQHSSRGWEFRLSDAFISNVDLAGTAYGNFQTEANGPGSVDAAVDLTHVALRHTARYIPLHAMNPKTHDWLHTALQDGNADSFHLRLRGDLRDFPFAGNEHGLFRIEAKAKGVALEFDKAWPRVEDAQANLLIEGKYLEVNASSATTAGAHVQKVKVSVADVLSHDLVLRVNGEATDEAQRCLEYIRASPVRGYLGGFTDSIKASGDGRLDLKLEVPLNNALQSKVTGNFRFNNNDVDFGENVPLLSKVTGNLAFTQTSVSAGDIKAQILGGPAQVSVQSEEGGVLSTKAKGRADLDNYRKLVPNPLLQRVRGYADWNTEIRVQGKQVDVFVASDLQGVESDLPAPLGKRASDRIPLRFEERRSDVRQDMLHVRYGSVADAVLMRNQNADGIWNIRRGQLALGGAAAVAGKEGIWIVGKLPLLSVQGWSGLDGVPGGKGVLPNIAGVDVMLDKLVGYGNTVNALNIKGSSRNGLVSMRLASRELNGDVIWQPQGNGKLLVRMKNVMLGEGPHDAGSKSGKAEGGAARKGAIPTIDVAVERLSYQGRQLGKLELQMSAADSDVLLDNLRLTNPDGVLNVNGRWFAAPERTQINLRLDISDVGKILSRSGYPDSLKDGSGSLVADMNWLGAPNAMTYPHLNGTLHLNVGKGRFMKVDPGAAKLLGVLSLQSIPKRISLDFTDVFSGGFQFDSITGNAFITNGLLLTNDMKLTGAAAKVTLYGQVDLERETQNLKVRILPTIGDNVSLLSFAAGPVVGVGVLLANKILRDPLDKLVSFEYNVSGSWADPKVERLGQVKPKPESAGAAE